MMELANLPWGDHEYLEIVGERDEALFLFGLLCEADQFNQWPNIDVEWTIDYDMVIIHILHMDVWETLDFLRVLCENNGILVINDSEYTVQQPLPLWQAVEEEEEVLTYKNAFCEAFIW